MRFLTWHAEQERAFLARHPELIPAEEHTTVAVKSIDRRRDPFLGSKEPIPRLERTGGARGRPRGVTSDSTGDARLK